MTKKLYDLFNIPPNEELDADSQAEQNGTGQSDEPPSITEMQVALREADEAIDKIDAALPLVRELESTDSEMDELADLAKDKFNDLVDLAMNVEPRLSGQILQSAAMLLGHSITARQAKVDKKLRIIELQIRKARLDQMLNSKDTSKDDDPQTIDGKAIPFDRNALLREILASKGQNGQTKT